MTEPDPTLVALRREIDEVDATIHEALMRRVRIVERIAAAKGRDGAPPWRPAREAEVLRRLMARHRGAFPKPALVRIWREIMGAMVCLQGPFQIAVFSPGDLGDYWALARDHFGTAAPMTAHQNARSAFYAVNDRAAALAVLPAPHDGEADPWWPLLLEEGTSDGPWIAARLPATGDGDGGRFSALAVAYVRPQPSGMDHSYLAVRTSNEVSRASLSGALTAAGLAPLFLTASPGDPDPATSWFLAEIADFIATDDARVMDVLGAENTPAREIRILGTTPDPLPGADAAVGETPAGSGQT
jgi:chorismate mutase / prephenate dehydratase